MMIRITVLLPLRSRVLIWGQRCSLPVETAWTAPVVRARSHVFGPPRCTYRCGSSCFVTVNPISATSADKGHTCERTRNPNGSLSGADLSTAADAELWDAEDVYRCSSYSRSHASLMNHLSLLFSAKDAQCRCRTRRLGLWWQSASALRPNCDFFRRVACGLYRRMDFSVQCAYAHGTSALRTHLINMTPQQRALTWPAFSRLRDQWGGKVRLPPPTAPSLSHNTG